MNNWFEVGEQVLIESKNNPHLSGTTFTIREIVPKSGKYYDALNGLFCTCIGSSGFLMEESPPSIKYSDRAAEIIFHPSSLRKKHKPSSEDFQLMMDTLKTNIVETVE